MKNIITGIIVVCWLTAVGCNLSYGEQIGRIVAQVNSEIITEKDWNDYMKILRYKNPNMQVTDDMREEILERLIEDKLILYHAVKEGIEVPAGWIKEKLNEFIASYGSYREFEKSLISEGLNVTLLKERLKSQYLTQRIIDRYVRSKVYISPAQVTEFYQANPEQFSAERMFTLWIAQSKFDEQIYMLMDAIKEKGIENVDREKYNLTRVEIDEPSLKEDIKDIVLDLDIDESTFGEKDGTYYYIYLENISVSDPVTLQEAKEQIYSYLWQEEFRREFTEWIEELKKEAIIKRYE